MRCYTHVHYMCSVVCGIYSILINHMRFLNVLLLSYYCLICMYCEGVEFLILMLFEVHCLVCLSSMTVQSPADIHDNIIVTMLDMHMILCLYCVCMCIFLYLLLNLW